MARGDKNDFEKQRLDNIKRNQEALHEIGVVSQADKIFNSKPPPQPPAKKRRIKSEVEVTKPSRSSSRLASIPERPKYNEDELQKSGTDKKVPKSKARKQIASASRDDGVEADVAENEPSADLEQLRASWSSWLPEADSPTRDQHGIFHFSSHHSFRPNKSPSEMLHEGCFGGSYFRPLHSQKLRTTISDDYLELPASWTQDLDIERYLTSPIYDPDANKFKVACGQSIEQWEAAGWIEHRFDVRGWFQWYCRFFMGRRCDDDERQVSRWSKCVGPTGRWRSMLLKKYKSAGVREVFDDGADEDAPEVSPVMHQTCHHWAFEVTQEVLDEYWRTES
ncbi:hypothetical protein LSUE1_G006087 [Lachnellula suecica]|uniref:Vegetatible incompatibility protein HET-E-1 n=1 Tax=Lachnellula suecica TaxID=602035 RepID=A0A8T9CC46_9HELO|nr:hypothetical protein LSUE1_G006087 [Lachnellula suecica]